MCIFNGLSYLQRTHTIILRIIRLISYKLEVFQLLAEIMRVEEESFCTPRSLEVKYYSFLASTPDEARCQQHKSITLLNGEETSGIHRMGDEVDTTVSRDAFEKR